MKETGGAAFPGNKKIHHGDGTTHIVYSLGMDLRDYFAAKAMQVIAAQATQAPWARIAQNAYAAADAMIAAGE